MEAFWADFRQKQLIINTYAHPVTNTNGHFTITAS